VENGAGNQSLVELMILQQDKVQGQTVDTNSTITPATSKAKASMVDFVHCATKGALNAKIGVLPFTLVGVSRLIYLCS
jgi:uncharacterized protein (DUF39 family)